MEPYAPQPMTLTPRQVAKALGIGERAVYEALERKELPGVRVGRYWLIGRDALHRHVNQIPAPSPAMQQKERP